MIGFDLQQVDKIKYPEKLLNRIGLEGEIEYIKKFPENFAEKVASLWSAKEAVFKALDFEDKNVSFRDIELCHKENGAPYIKLYGKMKEQFERIKAKKIEISISHQENIVGAVVIVE